MRKVLTFLVVYILFQQTAFAQTALQPVQLSCEYAVNLLGNNMAAPAFKKIIIRPQPGALSWAKGSYKSVYGIIRSDWKKSSGSFHLKVSIPVNTSAEIWLPAIATDRIQESGRTIESNDGIRQLKQEKGYTVFAIGSGDFYFDVQAATLK